MATKAEIRQQVGEDLGLVPIGQTLESQDQTRIDNTFTSMYNLLKNKGLAAWAVASEVPEELVPDFCLLMEERLLISYSVPENRFLRIKSSAGDGGVLAIARIADLVTPPYVSTDDPVDY